MRRLLLLLLLAALVVPLQVVAKSPETEAVVPAADSADDELDIYLESIDVNVVNVEVHVTDKKGKPITGLTRDDFELFEDKRPVRITNFFAVENGEAKGEDAPKVETGTQTLGRTRLDQVAVPESQQLHLIVYVDNFNLRPFNRNRAFRGIRVFLRENLQPEDRVMLVTYDRSLKERHPFTTDKTLISSVLFELEKVTAHGLSADSDRRDILDAIYEERENQDSSRVRGRVIQYAQSLENDLRFSIDSLKQMVDTLAGLPGRKALLYVSDGLPMRAGEDAFHAMSDKYQESSILMETFRFDSTRSFQEITAKANTNGVVFYTLEAAGLRTYSYLDASNANLNGGAQIDQIHFSNLQAPLFLLAQETGGFAITNTNNFVPMLARVGADFDNYYSLGYESGDAGLGRYHRFKVKLKGGHKGLRIRYRDGYRDKPVEVRMADSTMAALHFGYQRNLHDVVLEFGSGTRRKDGLFLVSLKVRFPLAKLSFLPTSDQQHSRVRLFVAAKDTDGGTAEVSEVPVPISIPAMEFESAQSKHYQYEMTLLMKRGSQVVAVGLRDELSSSTSFVARGVTVGQ